MQMNPRPAKTLNPRPTKQLNEQTQELHVESARTQSISTNQILSKTPPVQVSTIQQSTDQPAFMNQQSAKTINSTIRPDTKTADSISVFVASMKDMVSSFAILNDDVISHNLQLAHGGFSAEDRTISFEVANYIMSNMGFVFMGLVLDDNFKKAFIDSVNVELNFDKQSDTVKAVTREKMGKNKTYKTKGSMVIGTSDFVPEVRASLAKKMHASFEALDAFADEFDTEIQHLTREKKLEYGFIFSNFMYLIRAFTHNDVFMSYVIAVIEKVKGLTGNK